jgi:hypothetical protein
VQLLELSLKTKEEEIRGKEDDFFKSASQAEKLNALIE